ncbi:MAG: hypothetical protein ACRDQ2_13700 [Gaiellales bacterium]
MIHTRVACVPPSFRASPAAPRRVARGLRDPLDLRYQIRRFLRSREITARAAGVEPQQYLVLLQVKGVEGRSPASIGILAEQLQVQPHGMDGKKATNVMAARTKGIIQR